MMPADKVERGLQTGMIEIAPLAFMRGRTLANAVVILDEAQNTTPMQMKMFLTRLGEGIAHDRHRRSQPDRPAARREIRPGRGACASSTGVEGIGRVTLHRGRRRAPPLVARDRQGLRVATCARSPARDVGRSGRDRASPGRGGATAPRWRSTSSSKRAHGAGGARARGRAADRRAMPCQACARDAEVSLLSPTTPQMRGSTGMARQGQADQRAVLSRRPLPGKLRRAPLLGDIARGRRNGGARGRR